MKLSVSRVAVAALFALSTAGANAVDFNFGTRIDSPSNAPYSVNFATLSISEVGADLVFSLDAFGLDLFTGTPFIGTLAVTGAQPAAPVSNISGGVSTVDVGNGDGPDGSFDYNFGFGQGQDRLTDGETVQWTVANTTFDQANITNLALHVQGINYPGTTPSPGTSSAWYGAVQFTPAIPEPETYALMLAGLGAVSLVARRRKNG